MGMCHSIHHTCYVRQGQLTQSRGQEFGNRLCVVFGAYSGLAVSFSQLGASVENFQVAMIRKEPMALFAGRLTDHTELYHVLQSLRHSWSRERELFGCRWDRYPNRFAEP
jgi:hypothetical protein